MSADPADDGTGRSARTAPSGRSARRERTTKETSIAVAVDLDGPTGSVSASTGLPFFDHMLDQIGRHGGFDLEIEATGDLHVDGHHTVEDVGIALGEVFTEALGDKAGIRRFASGLYPLDEALVEVAVDLSGRPWVAYDVPFGEVLPLGNPPFNPEMVEHFWQSFATAAGITLHVSKRAGTNTHHVIEATFKGVSRCLRDAVRVEGAGVPSTKGFL
ncbi:MAG: imidazoleglycerol-phosphate dehydratase HisB [Acidimicrobiales bacterium]